MTPTSHGPTPAPLEVVAGIVVEDGNVLVAQRHRNQSFPLLWEFPGGKVERGESPQAALAREFREELGVQIEVLEPYDGIEYPGREGAPIRVRFFRARRVAGEPQALEVEQVAWVPAAELSKVDFIPANREVVARLEREFGPGGSGEGGG